MGRVRAIPRESHPGFPGRGVKICDPAIFVKSSRFVKIHIFPIDSAAAQIYNRAAWVSVIHARQFMARFFRRLHSVSPLNLIPVKALLERCVG